MTSTKILQTSCRWYGYILAVSLWKITTTIGWTRLCWASAVNPQGFCEPEPCQENTTPCHTGAARSLHREKHCACRLFLACATYVLTHMLIIGWLMCSCDASRGSGELLLRSLLSAHTFACLCLIMFNGLRNAGRPRQILFSVINESTGSLYKGKLIYIAGCFVSHGN